MRKGGDLNPMLISIWWLKSAISQLIQKKKQRVKIRVSTVGTVTEKINDYLRLLLC